MPAASRGCGDLPRFSSGPTASPNSRVGVDVEDTRSDSSPRCLDQHLPPLNATITGSLTIGPWFHSLSRAAFPQGWLSKPNGASPRTSLKNCRQHEQHYSTEPYRDSHQPRSEHPATPTASRPHRDFSLSYKTRPLPLQAAHHRHKHNHPRPSPPLRRANDDAPAGSQQRYSSSSASQQAPRSAPSWPRPRR